MNTQPSRPTWNTENACSGLVCGIDEVGRAPLAGPVVAACAYIPGDRRKADIWAHVTDSKALSRQKRERLYDHIFENACVATGEARIEEIEEINIYHASLLAMRRAFEKMCADFDLCMDTALIDGNAAPQLSCAAQTIVKGDSKSLSIAAASIVAKVYRDRLMSRLHDAHPHYEWHKNAGYPVPAHLEGIMRHGVTPHHRRSFAPVKNYIACGNVDLQAKLAGI